MATLQKLAFLRTVPLFRYASDEILLEIADNLIERYATAGEEIVRKGQFGTEMYIITKGRVKVHDGDRIIVELKEHDVFGELAALSPEVRIASVTAIENTFLLIIDHEDLYETMSKSMGFVKGIIDVLCQRARAIAKNQP